MRVTHSSYYRNLMTNQNRANRELFDVSRQISSGFKIKYGHDDTTIFADTMRLDNEESTVSQIIKTASSAKQVNDNSDNVITQIKKTLEKFKTKLIYASNDTHSLESRDALAHELDRIKSHLMSLANTSINGKYLFSGTSMHIKPIGSNGEYRGNDGALKTFLGSGVEQQYSISGRELFMGENSVKSRTLTTNIPLYNQSRLNPEVMIVGGFEDDAREIFITSNDTIRDLIGDNDNDITNDGNNYFYVSGRGSDGVSFKEKITLTSDAKVEDLLNRVGEAYGNSAIDNVVNVEINKSGQIEVRDIKSGSSLMEFHIVGSKSDVNDISNLLSSGGMIKEFMVSDYEPNRVSASAQASQDFYNKSILNIPTFLFQANGEVAAKSTNLSEVVDNINYDHVRLTGTDSTGALVDVTVTGTVQDFLDSIEANFGPNVDAAYRDGKINIIDEANNPAVVTFSMQSEDAANTPVVGFSPSHAISYDKSYFEKDGAKLTASIPQILTSDNSYANESTRLAEVAGVDPVDGEDIVITGKAIDGSPVSAVIHLLNTGSTFEINGTTYNILNDAGATTPAADVTYKQMFDVMNMVMSNTLPASATHADYETATMVAGNQVNSSFNHKGQIVVYDKVNATTSMELSMNDSSSGDFSVNEGSAFLFNANNAIAIEDPKNDFFYQLEEMIKSVYEGTQRPDGDKNGDPRSIGMQNALSLIDDVMEHMANKHTKIGAIGQTLFSSVERNESLKINIEILRSEVIDVDLAEASLRIKQLEINYQAMLSTVSRINKLSLVNYL